MSLSECLKAKWFALDMIEKVEAMEAEIENLKAELELAESLARAALNTEAQKT